MTRLTCLLLPAALIAAQARYARLGEFDGAVEVQLRAADQWMPAERNLPLPESAWLRTGAASRLEIELDEGSAWRLGPDSQGEISDYSRLSTGQRVTLLSLDHGLAYFTGQAERKDVLMLAVPGAQVTLSRAARVRLEAEETWSQISVIEGVVRFSSPAAEIDLREGQTTRVEPAHPARFFLYKEVASMESDHWSEARDKALAVSPSAGHVNQRYGLVDLDTAGTWTQTEILGAVWKPKVIPAGWAPYRNGRWRWYDALGYTWVSDDPWGWLPYHYGRWTRMENLGWVWAPARTAVFKPGEVYWLYGAKLAGWGPLAPGENWTLPDQPLQYLNVNTTFAAFQPDAAVIDPAGFTARPKEPLLAARFTPALPSPALAASRLDATRPQLHAGSTRVVPVLDGVTFESSPAPSTPSIVVMNPPPPPPLVLITPPPEQAEGASPDAAYPVPVVTGIVLTPQAPQAAPTAAPKPAPAPAPPPEPASGPRKPTRPPTGGAREKKFRPGERTIAAEVAKDINGNNFVKALVDLDTWSQRFGESDFEDDRSYYSVLALNGVGQPGEVLKAAAPLLAKAGANTLDDPRQLILVFYLASLNAQKLTHRTREQTATARDAARSLLDAVPVYFTSENRPPTTTAADWTKARTDLEAAARATLQAFAARR